MRTCRYIIFLLNLCLLSGCGCKGPSFSLSGINIPPDVENISVQYFTNEASYINPTLSQRFTEQLKDKFLRETKLTVIASNGDYRISGTILEYKTEPVATSTTTGATKNRFSTTVKVVFECPKHKDMDFTENITKFQEFDASQNFQSLETQLSDEVNKQIIQEVFNKVALKW
jgi:predicted small lipoprotein YifL